MKKFWNCFRLNRMICYYCPSYPMILQPILIGCPNYLNLQKILTDRKNFVNLQPIWFGLGPKNFWNLLTGELPGYWKHFCWKHSLTTLGHCHYFD
jgi:hypothetical protein